MKRCAGQGVQKVCEASLHSLNAPKSPCASQKWKLSEPCPFEGFCFFFFGGFEKVVNQLVKQLAVDDSL